MPTSLTAGLESFSWLRLPLAAIAAVVLDRLFGEPRRWHPLVGFGRLANWLEARCRLAGVPNAQARAAGLAAWTLAVLPGTLLAAALCALPGIGWWVSVLCLYFALGAKSLAEHVGRVAADLRSGDLDAARTHVGWIVSRDTAGLDEAGIAKAAVETTLENGNDAVFGALFWFAVGGGAGAVLFRLANTLDAMWGYKTPRFLHFGWAAARLDDGLNWLPARLTALTYALFGRTRGALRCWRTQAPAWESPNAGPVMAAGAGSLGLALGGAAFYHGREEVRPPLGEGVAPTAADIGPALALVRNGIWLWLGIGVLFAAVWGLAHA